jgi:hypothetical protein
MKVNTDKCFAGEFYITARFILALVDRKHLNSKIWFGKGTFK